MPRHLGCRNVSECRYVVERMNERGEWTSKHYVSQRDITEELGITRTAIYYLVVDDPVKAGASNKNVRIKKLAKPLPVFVVERVPVRYSANRAEKN